MLSFKTRRTVPFLAVSLCALSLAACGGSGDKGQPLDLTILHINDHHSHLDAETTALTLKDAAGASKSVTVELGGFARVSAAIEALAVVGHVSLLFGAEADAHACLESERCEV